MESFSESDDLRAAISFSRAVDEEEYWDNSRLYFSCS